MNIDVPLRTLGTVDTTELTHAIMTAENGVWLLNEFRQKTYEVHYNTQSLVMLFTDTENWPDITVTKEAGWDIMAEAALPLMKQILAEHFPPNGVIIRAMAARLLSGSVIKPHVDAHPSFHHGHRIHIPITTNPRVRFNIDGQPYQLQLGQAYEINNQKTHSVMNRGKEDRITFIFDYIPPSHLQGLSVNQQHPELL